MRAVNRAASSTMHAAYWVLGYSLSPVARRLQHVRTRLGLQLERLGLPSTLPQWVARLGQGWEDPASGQQMDGTSATVGTGTVDSANGGLPAAAVTSVTSSREDSSLATVPLGWWSLFEETTLRAPAYSHVMLAFRHADAAQYAHHNGAHVALALFRNVPKVCASVPDVADPKTATDRMPLEHTHIALPATRAPHGRHAQPTVSSFTWRV